MPQTAITTGSRDAKFLIVGEAPGESEAKIGANFVGSSGRELARMLTEAGWDLGSLWPKVSPSTKEADIAKAWEASPFRLANVVNLRPPGNKIFAFMPETKKDAVLRGAKLFNDKWVTQEVVDGHDLLMRTIREMPNLQMVIPAGGTALWALTGKPSISAWRGSQLKVHLREADKLLPMVPIYHPAGIMRNWADRMPTLEDLRRAKRWVLDDFREPAYRFLVRPSFSDVCSWLQKRISSLASSPRHEVRLSVDLETRHGHMACIGLADSPLDALCIPLLYGSGSYWRIDEEVHILTLFRRLVTHPRVRIIGQNWLYDRQYFAKHLGLNLRPWFDTMVAQHVCFPGIPKGLDFIASLYNHFYCYWKSESKDWSPHLGEEQLWLYNCKDAVATWEAAAKLQEFITAFGFQRQLDELMTDCEWAFKAMLRGVRVDFEYKKKLADMGSDVEGKDGKPIDRGLIAIQMREHQEFIRKLFGKPRFSIASPKQVHWLCYDILKLPPIRKPGSPNLTADKDAIAEWMRSCEPLYRPVLQSIADYRSLQVFRGTFALAGVDPDGRFRCSINVAGPGTFRLSTNDDAFGFGTNMQNLPEGDED